MDVVIEFKNSLNELLCNEIINLFENEKINHKKGRIGYNAIIDLNIKDTHEILLDNTLFNKNKRWEEIKSILQDELNKNILEYFLKIDNLFMINNDIFKFSGFQIQKYIKNEGKYTYHDDFTNYNNNDYRIITYIWYLNDVIEGGETEFLEKYKIIPEKGKLLLFPSFWTHPHCGLMPISNDKYIITGWVIINDKNMYI